jgi:hypothetical protein
MAEIPFHPAARAEAIAASLYLESERVGYGERFEQELDEVLARIEELPKSGKRLPGSPNDLDVRAHPMSTFRYSLIVASPRGAPMVYAVAHQHRRPGYWLERIE